MTLSETPPESSPTNLAINSLPKTALQAIYHAVTGKTENLSKTISGNVTISSENIESLYQMILDQMGHYRVELDPTTTILVKYDNHDTVTYSSWSRFNTLRVKNFEVTSQVIIKVEFICIMPNTTTPQRCSISIILDSSLPVIKKQPWKTMNPDILRLFVPIHKEWRTVEISIDFVDYLIAKNFCNIIQEWFEKLDSTPSRRFTEALIAWHPTLNSIINQCGRLGMAAFIMTYIIINSSRDILVTDIALASAVALVLWSLFSILSTASRKQIPITILSNIVPSVILLTEGDKKAFKETIDSMKSSGNALINLVFTIIFGIALNIASSYIYSWFTQPT